MREIKAVLLLPILLLLSYTALSQKPYPEVSKFNRNYLENYSQREYGDNLSVQNWSVTQDHRGIMYFGNASHVLEYDGINWDNTRTPLHTSYITALFSDDNGNVFVGGNGEFGYLKNDKFGKKYYVSLSDSLEIEDSFFMNIWRIYNYRENILFFAQESIYLWDGNDISIIYPETSFHLAFVVGNELYVRQREIGLMKLSENNEFEPIPGGDAFKDFGVFGMFEDSNNNILIATQELGLYKYYKNKYIQKINSPYTNYLNRAGIIGGTLLHNGYIALNTLRNGVIIIDFKGKIIQVIDQNSGLRDNEVKQVFQDSNNQLWLALNTGISMVNYNSTVWLYDFNTGLFGNTQSITMHDGQIYTGTTIGLFRKNKYPSDNIFKHFTQIEGLATDIKKMISVGTTLLIGSPDGLYGYEKRKGVFKIADIDASAIYWSEKNNMLFASGINGLYVFSKRHNWRMLAEYQDIQISDPLNIAEDFSTDNIGLWIGGIGDGVWQVSIKPDYTYDFEYYIGGEDGLGKTWIRPFNIYDKVLFGVFDGLLQFVDSEEILKSLPDTLIENAISIRGYFEPFSITNMDETAVSHLINRFDKTWMVADYRVYYGDNLNNLSHKPFQTINMGRIFDIHPQSHDIVWLATDDGLAKINTAWRSDYYQKPMVNLRKILIGNDSLLFHSLSHALEASNISIPYSSNKIILNFASSSKENGIMALYSYKMQGFDEDWSDWTAFSTKDYINLREGDYVFYLKAKDAYGNQSDVISFAFRVMPPWYRTLWAYISYGIALILLVILIVKLSIMRLKAKNIQLEKIIEKRTEEIRNQKDEIAKQHKIVVQQKEAITSSIRYASRIQNALVPHEDFLKQHLSDSFIFWIPRDIVSGDFYWIKAIPPYLSVVAADCTGHGVPGAFMSMLGISFLNELAQREDPGEVSNVLEQLRAYIKNTLGQTGDRYEQKDGMVLAFCTLNLNNNTLYFSGANTPLWIIRNNELIEYKATRNPIGIHPKEIPFEAHQIKMQKGDAAYMFSDGYIDQFGGPQGQRLGTKAFKALLLEICNYPMAKQKEMLDKYLKDWMTEEYTQLDDILVMGFRV